MKKIDIHVHAFDTATNTRILLDTADAHSCDEIALMAAPAYAGPVQNVECAWAKSLHPQRFYWFAGLEHSTGRPFLQQAQALAQMGCDGFKMIEGKPTAHKLTGLDLDDEALDDFYAFTIAQNLPILMHVADPGTFWDKRTAPGWAIKNGWCYDDGSFVSYEALYRQVERVLEKHPGLKLILAHFFFLSDNMIYAQSILDRFPTVSFDLTAGTEMYENFSMFPEKWRAFFQRYQDRILFGTDVTDEAGPEAAENREGTFAMEEAFLTTTEPFAYRDFEVRGLGLEPAVLEKIFYTNAHRYIADAPRPLDLAAIRREIDTLMACPAVMRDGVSAAKLRTFKELFA